MDWSTQAQARRREREALLAQTAPADLVENYRRLYGLGPTIGLEQVRAHLTLEGELADRLLAAPAQGRTDLFEQAYSDLYASLEWLNGAQNTAENPTAPNPERYRRWTDLLRPGARIYEVGSGQGNLARFLAAQGYTVVATEITATRGKRDPVPHLDWHLTDGVHLDRFEPAGGYDHIISDQVFEHLHPDDRLTHLKSARALLKPGGSYLLATPHAHAGPTDVTLILPTAERSLFMHLQEETYASMVHLCREAGYSRVEAIGTNPFRKGAGRTIVGKGWLAYQRLAESLESLLKLNRSRRVALRSRWSRVSRLESSLWLRLCP